MSIVRFNKGGKQVVTSTTTNTTPLTVLIEGRSYSTVGQSSANNTAAFFVAENFEAIASEFGIFISVSSAEITFSGISSNYISVTSGGSIATADTSTELGVEFNFMVQYKVGSATTIAVNLNSSSFSTDTDVLNLTFGSAKDKEAFINNFQLILDSQESGKSIVDSPIICSAALA
jgi:hypothetical protein